MRLTASVWAVLLVMVALGGCASTSLVAPSDLPLGARADDAQLVVVAVNSQAPVTAGRAGSTQRGYGTSSSYAVSDATRATLASISRDYQLTKVAEWPITALGMQCAVMRIPPGAARAALLARLATDQRVRLVQALQRFSTLTNMPASAPVAAAGDPYSKVQPSLQQMSVVEAHYRSTGQGIRIAVIDTGLDDTHPELTGRIALEKNFVDADARQFRQDRHGTAMGGIIAANENNGGMVGIAPSAQLLALKACWQLGPDSAAAECNSYTLAKALAEAIARRPQIINMSLTGPSDPLLQALAELASAQGIVLVGPAAALNTADEHFPASVPGLLSTQVATAARRSNTLSAPGSEILTLAPGGRYDFASGDSAAVAAVSGVAALLLAAKRDLTAAQIGALLNASTPAAVLAPTVSSGAVSSGTANSSAVGSSTVAINACQALIELLGSKGCSRAH
jgi:subtilisin family serine protease